MKCSEMQAPERVAMQLQKISSLPEKQKLKKKCSLLKVTKMGNITEVQYISHHNCKVNNLKMDKDHYVTVKDGVQHDYKHTENRSEGTGSLRKTFYKMRSLINFAVKDVANVRWITLTYAENMTDTKRLYQDFRQFNQRFKRFCKSSGYDIPEYIVMMEPQARGAWHAHLLYIWPTRAPFIPNETLARIWGHGFVKIKKLDNVDNVGAYLTAYMTDLVISEEDYKKGNITKAIQKGARLHLYPTGMQIVRHSRGIKEPEPEWMEQEEAEAAVKDMSETYRKTVHIQTDDGLDMYVETVYYNRIRNGATPIRGEKINEIS